MTEFHFLRPAWLLLLLLLPVMALVFRRLSLGDSGWGRVIPERLLAPVIRHRGSSGKTSRSPLLPVMAAVVVLAIALAGPAWRQAPTPLKQQGDSLVIVLDLSLSMLATDVEPNRLTLAKRKIRDILAARQGSLNGLIVYAADTHVVAPLTDDGKTIESMLDVLDPVIMPAPGNRTDLAITQARQLLDNGAPGEGRILLISDDVHERYYPIIEETLDSGDIPLSTLVVGTVEGGPIPLAKRGFIRDNGNIVVTRANREGLGELARQTGGLSHTLTLDNTDIDALALAASDQDEWQDKDSGQSIQQWQDDGYWLMWLVLPLFLIGWRRGAFAALLLTTLPLTPQPAQAMDWDALWQREDQRAPELIRDNPKTAADQLTSPEWRGSALYRAENYDQAARAFAQSDSARADYNRGNALARAGKLEQAIQAYDQALAKSPDLQDAQFNRDLVQQLLDQQQQQQSGSGQQDGEQNQDNRAGGSSQGGDQQPPSDSESSQEPSQGEGSGDQPQESGAPESAQNQGQQPGSEAEQEQPQPATAGADSGDGQNQPDKRVEAPAPISETPLSQGQEQWLRRIPDDPGGLLKRKFLQQYQERQTPSDEGDTPW
ncbi:VWA domain-containing protein [Marinobacter salinisoli]|uniref:VWA domain-containing protein n=1 Tax=Marinobacter salinisoli TaxID=2769486 RepID=A0ABX7MPV5_9GAMM|nr:VWA domain-containing protein [Marinobacter salinisoli]QSP94365.1 VWA domain-containing protein [Marinobacter salinisoli]